MNKWKSAVHGGMCIVMFANNSVAMAQQAVQVQDGKDVAQGAKADSACATPSTACSLVALAKAIMSGVNSVIPGQSYTASIGGVGMLVNTNNASAALRLCGTYTTLSISVATTLQIIGAASGQTIRICDFDISVGTATNVSFRIGTGTNCANGSTQLGQTWYAGQNWGKIAANPWYRGLNSGAVGSAALCVQSTVTSTVDVGVYYDQST